MSGGTTTEARKEARIWIIPPINIGDCFYNLFVFPPLEKVDDQKLYDFIIVVLLLSD
jgi:hypothetical protein